MRKVAIVVGVLFLVGGVLGMALHIYLYRLGNYESEARLEIGYNRYLNNTPIDEQKDAALVAESVRESLIYGSVYAGVPIVLGCILLLAAWRWKNAPIAGVAPAATDRTGTV